MSDTFYSDGNEEYVVDEPLFDDGEGPDYEVSGCDNDEFPYDIEYDSTVEAYVWWYDGTGFCLGATDMTDAKAEVLMMVENGEFPESQQNDEYDESMDGDFDSAMASAGFGTDEDYGCYDEC